MKQTPWRTDLGSNKLYAIKCCRDCVPPKRYPGCHSNCKEYKEEKARVEVNNKLKSKEKEKEMILNEFSLK